MTRYSFPFVVLVALFVVCLVTSNIIAVKLMTVVGLTVPVAVIIFPISYIAGDVLTEVYGYATARRVIWLGFACNLLVVIAIGIGSILPSAAFWHDQPAYEAILGYTPRLLLASFAAYLVGEHANSWSLLVIRRWTGGRWLWTRTIGSTIVGEGLDSLIFITIAFYGGMPLAALATTILTQWGLKTGYEALATPLTYVVVAYFKRTEVLS